MKRRLETIPDLTCCAIQTSETGMSAVEVIDTYHHLWKIEESLKANKKT